MPTFEHPLSTIELTALRKYRLGRVREQLVHHNYPAILLYDPINLRYAADSRNMPVWTLHNAVRYLFIPVQGPVVLFEFHGSAHLADSIETIDEVRPATAWYYFVSGTRGEECARRWASEIADLLHAYASDDRRIAIDRCDPMGVDALRESAISVHDGQAVMEEARLIKSREEIAAMRASLRVCESGMQRMREALEPGRTEAEIWSLLHQENIARGGEWIETRLLSSGPRTNPWFQECSDRVLEAGDLLSFDSDLIGPYNYCSDISRCWRVGDGPFSPEQRRLYGIAREQIEHNIEILRAGISYREFGERAYRLPAQYRGNRYSVIAHGVGLCDEYPAIYYPEEAGLYGYDGIVRPGMTWCIESYVGAQGGHEGVKLEEQVLITDQGVERLSRYPFEAD